MAGRAVTVTNFLELPGEFDDKQARWAFPPIEYANSGGKTRRFEVYADMRAANGKAGKAAKPAAKYWQTPSPPTPPGVVARYWTVTGVVGGARTMSTPTTVSEGKNVGKRNATNAWTQALREAYGRWLKAADRRAQPEDRAAAGRQVVPPMLLAKYADRPPRAWPQYMQVKYDGVRALVYPWTPEVEAAVAGKAAPRHAKTARKVGAVLLSRTLRVVPAWHIAEAALPFLAAHPAAAIDGELVAFGADGRLKPLQDISGMARNDATCGGLELVVFDVFDAGRPAAPFEARWRSVAEYPFKAPFVLAETVLVRSAAEAAAVHQTHLDAGHEGSVVRDPASAYVPSFNGLRSPQTLKWKPRYSAEFRCTGFASGSKGKAKGAVMWTVEIPPHAGGSARSVPASLTIDPNMPVKERKEIYARLVADPSLFAREYGGRALTVEFFDWSSDGIPLQPKAVAFRDWDEVVP